MRLAILGAGDVGSTVAEMADEFGHTVTAIADSTSAAVDGSGIDTDSVVERKRTEGTVGPAHPEDALEGTYDVLVEASPTTLGDAQPGFGHVRSAFERDKHVVLANKGPVAERYGEIRDLEAASDGDLYFEATVGGAMPVLSTIENFGATHIDTARGVLNGTANFILSRMAAVGLDYADVLTEAQELGVAEADPTFDVDGTDAALKCVIIANVLACGRREFTLADADVEGIQELSAETLDLAEEDARTIRLVGEVDGDSVRVGPRLVPENGALAVTGTRNIVQFETTYAGRLNVSGRGAGGPETATAIFADIDRLV